MHKRRPVPIGIVIDGYIREKIANEIIDTVEDSVVDKISEIVDEEMEWYVLCINRSTRWQMVNVLRNEFNG